MTTTSRPAVERVQPPKAPYRVVNRVMRWLLSSPRRAQGVGRHLLLLHVVGRKSGRRFILPVAYRAIADGRLLVLTSSGWRANLRGGTNVGVTMFGERRQARANLVEDPQTVASTYLYLIEEVGHEKAGRRLGIRINVPRLPTLAELEEAARRDGLSLIYLTVDGPR
ncbi:nitroreductase/quinone reductase family protein [Actinoplanes sp. NBC_00393]|uniref:nitroreductase/quinone reductase family protein n=1 Tax=Actinoplanes sp. NBC_00393 TaxID=2975953 RepID=UPI002E1C2481